MQSIYMMGDSICMHYAPYLKNYLEGFFHCVRREGEAEARTNLDSPVGANTGGSRQVLEFVQQKRSGSGINADFLLFNCGLHDIRRDPVTGREQTPVDEYVFNLGLILDEIALMRPRPVWVRTTPCVARIHNARCKEFHRFGEDVNAYNAAADGVMKERRVSQIDLHGFTTNLGSDDSLYCDHVHFSEPTREKQAAFVAGNLMAFRKTGIFYENS